MAVRRWRRESRRGPFRAGPWCLVVVGFAVAAVGCGSRAHPDGTARATARPATTGGAAASSPALTVSPSSGLVGGQRLQVRLTGFPRGATVEVYECAGTPGSAHVCGAGASAFLVASSAGRASGPFVAQPAAARVRNRTPAPCRDQCELVGLVIKDGNSPVPSPAPMATARLSFATTAVPGLGDAFLQDVSWVSPAEGWALAAQPCPAGTCARLARTTDGGAHWRPLPSPPAQVQAGDGSAGCSAVACVSGVRFAGPAVGYLYGPALLMTTDGGRTWRRVPSLPVEALEPSAGTVIRVVYDHGGCPGPCTRTVQESTAGSAAWHTLLRIPLSSAPGGVTAQLVRQGPSDIYLPIYGNLAAGAGNAAAVIFRSASGGRSWQRLTDPCGLGHVADGLAAAPAGFAAVLCLPRDGTGPTFVLTSTDHGSSWSPPRLVPGGTRYGLDLIAAASQRTLAVATGATGGNGTFTSRVRVSADGGRHWTTRATDPQQLLPQASSPDWLGFQTARDGRWIGDPHGIWSTRDGGRHWVRTAFR